MRWGECLESSLRPIRANFIFVPPYAPHQEINANPDSALEMRRGAQRQRSRSSANLELPTVEPEEVRWVELGHPGPEGSRQ